MDSADDLLYMLQQQKRQTIYRKLAAYNHAIFRIKDGSGLLLLAEAAGTSKLFNVQQINHQLIETLGDIDSYYKPCHVATGLCNHPACSKMHPRFTSAHEVFKKFGGDRVLECLFSQPQEFVDRLKRSPSQPTLPSDPLWKGIFLPVGELFTDDLRCLPERRYLNVWEDADCEEIRKLMLQYAILQAREVAPQILVDRKAVLQRAQDDLTKAQNKHNQAVKAHTQALKHAHKQGRDVAAEKAAEKAPTQRCSASR